MNKAQLHVTTKLMFKVAYMIIGLILLSWIASGLQSSGFFGDIRVENDKDSFLQTDWDWGIRHHFWSWGVFILWIIYVVHICNWSNRAYSEAKKVSDEQIPKSGLYF
jgi:hypothetical protein